MFERPESGERTLVVQVNFQHVVENTDFEEGLELARSAGAEVVATLVGKRSGPDPRFFIGSGKIAELKALVVDKDAELVIFNHKLLPIQERNIEKEIQCRVIDRTGLILAIFAKRARTFEGKLQVELAQLKYHATRLVRGWTHLERQRGGGIGMTGPGETQLELDRRLIKGRIAQITKRLAKVRRDRELGRRARQAAQIPSVALVGYTNAGKSTLFNQMTASTVVAQDMLFATLDPTTRRCRLQGLGDVVLVDTVGFIRDLPHDLVEAFKATLEETLAADLLLHIVDSHHPDKEACMVQVHKVLTQIGADEQPMLEVMNKIDILPGPMAPRIDRDETGKPRRVWLSCKTQAGLTLLAQSLLERLSSQWYAGALVLSAQKGALRAALYEKQAILAEEINADGHWVCQVSMDKAVLERLCREQGCDLVQLCAEKITRSKE